MQELLAMTTEFITTPQIAMRWGVSHSTVLRMVQNGTLKAQNLSTVPNGIRARWRVRKADLLEFEASRSNQHLPGTRARKVAANMRQWKGPS